MKTPSLTEDEKSHIAKGGRVFIVEEMPGPFWRVLGVNRDACSVLFKPDGLDGYSDLEYSREIALVMANLSEDNPLVREAPWTSR